MARSKDDKGGGRRGGGGGGRGGRGGKGNDSGSRDVLVSKRLSWLLRHGAEQEGLKLGAGGYIPVSSVLSTRRISSLSPKTTLEEIREIVASNEKQRFSLIHISETEPSAPSPTAESGAVDPASEERGKKKKEDDDDDDPAHWLIRANQGHSLAVETEGLLKELTLDTFTKDSGGMVVVHGTLLQRWSAILKSGGLKPMTRNHVHFATGVPKGLESVFGLAQQQGHWHQTTPELAPHEDTENSATGNDEAVQIKSGMRNSSTLLIFINIRLALKKGIKFWMSDNGVVLSEGNASKIVPIEVFERVVKRGGQVLMENGIETTGVTES